MEIQTARQRAEDTEAKIGELRAQLADMVAREPKASPRGLASAFLAGAAAKLPSATEIARFDAERQRLALTIEGLIEIRVELEFEIAQEQIDASADAAMVHDRNLSELGERLAAAQHLAFDLEGQHRGALAQSRTLHDRLEKEQRYKRMLNPPAHGYIEMSACR